MKAHVVSQLAVSSHDWRTPQDDPDDKRYQLRILAEGDSWFSMGSFPEVENVLLELDLPVPAIIVDLAEPGDEIVQMASHVKAFRRLVAGKTTAYDWDAILLSGGGNDLIDACGQIIQVGESTATCVNEVALAKCMASVEAGYRKLAAIRDAAPGKNAKCPMIAHTYDYPTPRNSPARFFGNRAVGPWLFPALSAKHVTEDL